MVDQLDVPLEDSELLAEVELTTNLIIAASAAKTPLSVAEVDRLLGLHETKDAPRATVPTQRTRHSA